MQSSRSMGYLAAITSGCIYAVMSALVKYMTLTPEPPSFFMILFIESLVACICLTLYLRINFFERVKTNRLPLMILRGVAGVCMVGAGYVAVKFLPVADTVVLLNTAPLFLPFILLVFVHERISLRLTLPMFFGFAGVILVVDPNAQVFSWPALLALGAGFCFSIILFTTSLLTKTETIEKILFYYFLISSLVTGIFSILNWQETAITNYMLICLLGILFVTLQGLLNFSLKYIDSTLTGILFYATVIAALIIDRIFWNTIPNSIKLLGISLIVISCIWSIWVRRRLEKV